MLLKLPPHTLQRRALWLLILIMVSGCIQAPDTPTSPIQSRPPARSGPATSAALAPVSTLQHALTFAPPSTSSITFLDWDLLKEVAGVPHLTSADDLNARVDFLLSLGQKEQVMIGAFASMHALTHAETWGWDSTDLRWEASLVIPGAPPLYLLRFRDDFDFLPVLARFDEYGFSQTDYQGVPVYSHPFDLTQPWLRQSEFAILNTAYLSAGRMLILSSAPETVQQALDAQAGGVSLAQDIALATVVDRLGRVGTAVVEPMGCAPLDPTLLFLDGNPTPEAIEAKLEELRSYGIQGLYTAFGLGYRPATDDTPALGVLVHHYPSAHQAQADLEPRLRAAQESSSLRSERPYAELFEVLDGRVEPVGEAAAHLILELHGLSRPPQIFFELYIFRDLFFSVCGGF